MDQRRRPLSPSAIVRRSGSGAGGIPEDDEDLVQEDDGDEIQIPGYGAAAAAVEDAFPVLKMLDPEASGVIDDEDLKRRVYPEEVVRRLDQDNKDRLDEIRSDWEALVAETERTNAAKLEVLTRCVGVGWGALGGGGRGRAQACWQGRQRTQPAQRATERATESPEALQHVHWWPNGHPRHGGHRQQHSTAQKSCWPHLQPSQSTRPPPATSPPAVPPAVPPLYRRNRSKMEQYTDAIIDAYADSFVRDVLHGAAARQVANDLATEAAEAAHAAALAAAREENARIAELHTKEVRL